MSERVQALLDFYGTRDFGNRDKLLLNQRRARAAYQSLESEEVEELANLAVSRIESGADFYESCLCCLACFQPGSLDSLHSRLVKSRILYPGVIFHGADSTTAARLLSL